MQIGALIEHDVLKQPYVSAVMHRNNATHVKTLDVTGNITAHAQVLIGGLTGRTKSHGGLRAIMHNQIRSHYCQLNTGQPDSLIYGQREIF